MIETDLESLQAGVYVLELEHNKYYVGATVDLGRRLREHLEGVGADWTEKHTPISIHSIYPMPSAWVEDNVPYHIERMMTLKMMEEYTVDQVRGSEWATISLKDAPPIPEDVFDRTSSEPDKESLHKIAQSLC